MSRLVDYIENKEEFLTNEMLLEFFDEKVEIVKDRKVYLSITKIMFNYLNHTERENVYVEDVIKYKTHKSDNSLFVVDKYMKIIFINTKELIFSISGVSYSVLQSLLKSNKLVENIGDYKVISIENANNKFFNEIRDLEKRLNIENNKEIIEKGQEIFDKLKIDIDYTKATLLRDIRSNYTLDKPLFKEIKTDFISSNYDSKIYDVFYKIKSNNLDKLVLEYFRDRTSIVNIATEEYYKSLDSDKYNTETFIKEIFTDNLRRNIFFENKEILEKDLDVLRKKQIINTLKLAGKTVVINNKKYKNCVRLNYKNEIEIGDNYGNEYIDIDSVEKIEFRGKVLYSI